VSGVRGRPAGRPGGCVPVGTSTGGKAAGRLPVSASRSRLSSIAPRACPANSVAALRAVRPAPCGVLVGGRRPTVGPSCGLAGHPTVRMIGPVGRSATRSATRAATRARTASSSRTVRGSRCCSRCGPEGPTASSVVQQSPLGRAITSPVNQFPEAATGLPTPEQARHRSPHLAQQREVALPSRRRSPCGDVSTWNIYYYDGRPGLSWYVPLTFCDAPICTSYDCRGNVFVINSINSNWKFSVTMNNSG
jgi:hypothetical protein